MIYSLLELVEDKALRKSLLAAPFTFEDNSGLFGKLDFRSASMRSNLCTAYDILSRQGGDELLADILTRGKTCLEEAAPAPKEGLRAIEGTTRFSLKTNAAPDKQFFSILAGMAALAGHSDDFDAEAVTFAVEEEESDFFSALAEADFESLSPFSLDDDIPCLDLETLDLEEASDLLPECRFSFIQKNNSWFLWNDESNTIFSLPCEEIEGGELREMVEWKTVHERAAHYGYLYRLEADGLWGWIDHKGRQVLPPLFKHIKAPHMIVIPHHPVLVMWTPDQPVLWYLDGEEYLAHDLVRELEAQGLPCPIDRAAYLPGETITFDKDSMGNIYYQTTQQEQRALLWYEDAENGIYDRRLYAFRSDKKKSGVISYKDWAMVGDSWTDAPLLGLAMSNCITALRTSIPGEEIACVNANHHLYAVRKEGLWALWTLDVYSDNKVFRQHTPYAFTGWETTAYASHIVLDQFGKKGLYNFWSDRYVIPFEYERIQYSVTTYSGGVEYFDVERMGFIGKIDKDGKWLEHLHRETEEK